MEIIFRLLKKYIPKHRTKIFILQYTKDSNLRSVIKRQTSQTASDYEWLPVTTSDYKPDNEWLQATTRDYEWLQARLRVTTSDYEWLQVRLWLKCRNYEWKEYSLHKLLR